MKAGAKMVAAIDAAIDRKYGPATLAADKMKRAARESVAQTLERGGRIAVPRAREADQQKEASVEQARTRQNDRAIDRSTPGRFEETRYSPRVPPANVTCPHFLLNMLR